MKPFIISEFVNILYVCDAMGRTTFFDNRYSDCFILPLKGRICFSFDGKSHIADKNNPIYLTKGLKYTNTCLEAAESVVINFNTFQNENCARTVSCIDSCVIMQYYKSISERSICTEFSPMIFSELYMLAAMLFKDDKSVTESSQKEAVDKAIAYMRENYADSGLTMSSVARHCNISEVYLRKLFKSHADTTPHAYLTTIRMNSAYLLCLEKRHVKEITHRVGYSDVYQFSRAYKKHFGFSPSNTLS